MSQIHLVKEPLSNVTQRRQDSSSLLGPTTIHTSIHRHTSFWDKANKGYITPLDTISGFMTLGYGVVLSVALGTVMGIFLSVSTQSGWMPDPLCRSSVANIIHAKDSSQHAGAYNIDGSFNPEKFDLLFEKYAKTDKSHQTITVTELMRMTREQENWGKNLKAWATSMMELCTVYFFSGYKGTLTKEEVQSAYDGSFFFRLRDKNRLLIQGKQQQSNTRPLNGKYLSRSSSAMDIKAVEQKMQVLLRSLNTLKDHTVSKSLKRSPSMVNGVEAPKSKAFPRSFTWNAMRPSLNDYMGLPFGSSEVELLTSSASGDSQVFKMPMVFTPDHASGDEDTAEDYPISRNLLKEETQPSISHSESLVSFVHDDDWTGNSTSSIESDTDTVTMSEFLRSGIDEDSEIFPSVQLTGVLSDNSEDLYQDKDTLSRTKSQVFTEQQQIQLGMDSLEKQEEAQQHTELLSAKHATEEESSTENDTSDNYPKVFSPFPVPASNIMPPSPPQTFDGSNYTQRETKENTPFEDATDNNQEVVSSTPANLKGKSSKKGKKKNISRRD